MKVFCELDHPRSEMERDIPRQEWVCSKCMTRAADEMIARAVPPGYLLAQAWGLTTLLDVGDIYITLVDENTMRIEHPRVKDIQ